MRKVFISYARANKHDIDQLVEHLGMLSYDTWVDSSLRGGQDWWDEILQRIADCDVFMPIISTEALNSQACKLEFDWAEALGKPVLPVAVEPQPLALPRRFHRRQIVDYSNPGQRAHAALMLGGGLTTLPSAPPLPEPLPQPPAIPLSYLTDLVDSVSDPNVLDHEQQRQIVYKLESALRSVDPEERRGGRAVLEKFSSRDDLYFDVGQSIDRLRLLNDQLGPAAPDVPDPGSSHVRDQQQLRAEERPLPSSNGPTRQQPQSDTQIAPEKERDAEPTPQKSPARPPTTVTRGAAAGLQPGLQEPAPTTGRSKNPPSPIDPSPELLGQAGASRDRGETALKPPDLIGHLWKSTLASGLLAVILGILLLIWPGITLLAIAVLLSLYLLLTGIAQLFFGWVMHVVPGVARIIPFVSGAASVTLAVLAFLQFRDDKYVHLYDHLLGLGICLAVGLIVRGSAQTVAALTDQALPGRGWRILPGIINVIVGILIAGIVILALPAAIVEFALFAGLGLIVIGFCEIWSSFGFRKAASPARLMSQTR